MPELEVHLRNETQMVTISKENIRQHSRVRMLSYIFKSSYK